MDTITTGGKTWRTSGVKLRMFLELILLKYLYMISISLMLQDSYLIWPFDKNIDFFLSLIELIPFTVCLVAFLHFYRRDSAYSFFSTLLFIVYYIPTNSGLSMSGNDPKYYLLINIYSIIIFVVLGYISNNELNDISEDRFDIKNLYESKRRMRIIRTLVILVCLISLVYVYAYNGLDFSLLRSSDMYTTRGDYATYVAENTDSLLSYFLLLFRCMTKWFLPLALYFALTNKKIIDIVLCLVSFLALFTVSMEKSTLLIAGVVFFLSWAEKHSNFSRISELLIRIFIIFFVITLIEFSIRRESVLFNMVVRREFYMPAWLTKIYYDFFETNPKMWFRQDAFFVQNILSVFFEKPYPTGSTGIISRSFFNGLIPSPNTGMFAEAYGQMGVLGVFVFPFIVGALTKILRKSSDWYGDGAVAVIMVILCLDMHSVSILASSAFIGILLVLFVTFLIKNYYRGRKKQTFQNNLNAISVNSRGDVENG